MAVPDFSLVGRLTIVIIAGVGITLFTIYYFNQKSDADADFYSPIHSMIVRINSEVPREKAFSHKMWWDAG
jgi:hypothetical protein